jgi:glycosyltransferase involved in cell wall biosynthesis
VDGEEKSRLISSAWVLINTSIQESLAVSFLEALSCETPVVSCLNTEDVVARFGVYVGRWDGDGRDSLPRFTEALDRLLRDADLRTRLGREGRAWVAENHNPARFLEAFRSLCARAGLQVGS